MDRQIIQDCIHYNLTGEINDRLLVGFDQHRQWLGLFEPSGEELDPSLTRHLSKLVIPKDRLMKIGKEARITLMSSYFADRDGPLTVNFHRIEGDFSALNITAFRADRLEFVRGHLCLDFAREIDARKLRFVGGRLNAWEVKTFKAPELQNVGEDLNCQSTIEFIAPKLSSVGGFNVGSAKALHLPLLQVVDGDFDVTCAKELHVPNLMMVGGDLHAATLLQFRVPCLRSVYGHIDATKAKEFHAPMLESIGEDLHAEKAKVFVAPHLKMMGGEDPISRMDYPTGSRSKGRLALDRSLKSGNMPELTTAMHAPTNLH